MRALNNIKISGKIGIGFGAVLILLVLISGVGFLGLTGAGSSFSEYRSLARAANESGRVQANLLETRMAVKDFIIAANPETVQAVYDGVERTNGFIDETERLIDNAEYTAMLDAMHEELANYRASFDRIVDRQASRDELVNGSLNVIGPQIEQALSGIMRSAYQDGDAASAYDAGMVLRSLLLGRLYVNRYLVDNSAAAYERATTEFTAVQETMGDLAAGLADPERRRLAAEAGSLTEQYRDSLAQTFAAIEARNAEIAGGVDTIGPQIAQQIEDLKLAFKERQDILGPEAEASMNQAITLMAVAAVLAVLLGVAAAVVIGRGISRPVTQMTGVMDALAGGKLDTHVPATDRGDEIGTMAKSVEVFQQKLQENERLQAQAAEEQKARDRRTAKVNELTQEFDHAVSSMLENVTSAVTQLRSTASSMTTVAGNANEQATAVAAAAEQATSNVETVSAASEELSSSIAEITRQVSQSTELATQAVADADETNQRVRALEDAAQKIGDVVDLITSIAEQTNLLALNATIEAARAGDAGKGFAVVASEVKSLANQTGKATEEIAQQIQMIQSSTGNAVQAIEQISGRIKEMANISTGIAAAVEEQDAATQEIARNVQEAATGTRQVSTAIVSVSEASNETGAAAGQVESASGSLANQSEELKGFVQRFLDGIRAA